MSIDSELEANIVTDIPHDIGSLQQNRKSNREIAEERRAATADKFKAFQERASKKMKERRIVKLKTKPIGQLKDTLGRISEEFINFRGIDPATRVYLDKAGQKKDDELSSLKQPSALK